jgi:hypothetical protein
MLAQSFKSAAELNITEAQKDALIKTLVLMETGKVTHAPIGDGYYPDTGSFTGQFNMIHWNSVHGCGTVACIGGTAELVSGVSFNKDTCNGIDAQLYRLFMPDLPESLWNGITPSQAARALRSYLTTGHANWAAAVGEA